MWASDKARHVAIMRLLRAARMDARGLWNHGPWEIGPTDLAVDYLENGSPLSSGEHLVLQVAFDLWNGAGGAKVGDLLSTLDGRLLRSVMFAVLARDGGLAPDSLDEALNSGDGSYRP